MGKGGSVKWIAFAEKLIKSADAGKEPEFVQLMYMSQEERAALNQGGQLTNAETIDDEITRAIFRVDFSRGAGLKQGEHSVVFDFTTDLPPVNAPVRIDTPGAAVSSTKTTNRAWLFSTVLLPSQSPRIMRPPTIMERSPCGVLLLLALPGRTGPI